MRMGLRLRLDLARQDTDALGPQPHENLTGLKRDSSGLNLLAFRHTKLMIGHRAAP